MIYLDSNANYPVSNTTLSKFSEGCKKNNISSYIDEKTAIEINNLKHVISFLIKDINENYDIIFTSGGSESNSTFINHFFYESIIKGEIPTFLCMTSEHSSITEFLKKLENDNVAKIIWIKPKWTGEFPTEIFGDLLSNCGKNACVICQSVNSETGCIQDIEYIQDFINKFNRKTNSNIYFAVDNVQGFARINYPNSVGDFISISFHKIGAPVGFGALLVRNDIELNPLIAGKQNNGKRGGTYNIGSIFAVNQALKEFKYNKCCSICSYFTDLLNTNTNVIQYGDYMKLKNKKGAFIVTFNAKRKLHHVMLICIVVNGEGLCGKKVKKLFEEKGIIIGTGSACNTNEKKKSGMASSDIIFSKSFLRFSFYQNTKIEVKKVVKLIIDIIKYHSS